MNFLKTNKPKLKSSLLKLTIQKKSDLSLNNSKENTHFVIERHSKQETNPSKPNKAKMAKSNSKNVKKTVNISIQAPKVQTSCSKQNWASKNDKTQSKNFNDSKNTKQTKEFLNANENCPFETIIN